LETGANQSLSPLPEIEHKDNRGVSVEASFAHLAMNRESPRHSSERLDPER
jgi:hypothetical protein